MLSSISGLYFAGHTPVPIPTGGTPAIANLIVYYNTADPASFSTTSTTVTNLTLIPNNGTRTALSFNTVRPAYINDDVITLVSNTAYVSNDVQTTVSFWLNIGSHLTQTDLVSIEYDASNYFKVILRTDGKIQVTVLNPGGAVTFISSAFTATNKWTMITASYSTALGANAYIAINDVITANYTVTTTNIIPKTQTTKIAASFATATEISRYMLWNTALSATQISSMYESQRGYFDLAIPGPDNTIPSPINLVAYYDMANTASYSTSTPTKVTSLTYYENTASMEGTYTFDNITPKNMKSLSNDYSNKLYLQNSDTATVSNYRPTTIAFWLKTSGIQTEATSELVTVSINGSVDFFKIIRGSNSFANNILFAQFKNGGFGSSTNMSNTQINQSGVWQLITMIIQPTTSSSVTFKSYINGVLLDTSGIAGSFFNSGAATQNTSLGMITSSNASWSKYMMWACALTDAQVTQLFNNQKAYYFGGFTGVLDFTGLGVLGAFIATNPTQNGVTNYGMAAVFGSQQNNLFVTPGTVNVSPPFLTIGTGGFLTSTSIGDTFTSVRTNYNVWINPISTVPGGQLMGFSFGGIVTITMSMNSSRQISATIVRSGVTLTLSSTTIIPTNKWSMVSVSVIVSDTLQCYLAIDGVILSGGGTTGTLPNVLSGANMSVTMMNSTNLRFNQITVIRDEYYTVGQLYEATKSSYGRV